MDDLLNEFLEETRDNLHKIRVNLTKLTQNPEDKEKAKEVYNAFKTIKGTSAFLSYSKIESLSQAAESIMEKVKYGSLSVSTKLLSLVSNVSEYIKNIVEEISSSGEELLIDSSLLIAEINAFIEAQSIHDISEIKSEIDQKQPPTKKEPFQDKQNSEPLEKPSSLQKNLPKAPNILTNEGKRNAIHAGLDATKNIEKKYLKDQKEKNKDFVRVDIKSIENLMSLVQQFISSKNHLESFKTDIKNLDGKAFDNLLKKLTFVSSEAIFAFQNIERNLSKEFPKLSYEKPNSSLNPSITPVIIIGVHDKIFAVPQSDIIKVINLNSDNDIPDDLQKIEISDIFKLAKSSENGYMVIYEGKNNQRFGFLTNEVLKSEEVIIKPKNRLLNNLKVYKGFAILESGKVVPVLNLLNLKDPYVKQNAKSSVKIQAHNIKKINQIKAKEQHVLMVDDSSFFRKFMGPIITNGGYKLTSCQGAMEALEILNRWPQKFDIVISDINMPIMNGIEFTKKIKRQKPTSNIPVIALVSDENELSDKEIIDSEFAGLAIKADRNGVVKLIRETLKDESKNKNIAV